MGVKVISSMKEFREAIDSKAGSVIDFHAEWCGPCKMISPKFEAFSEELSSLGFYSVDVDAVPDVAEECGIQAMPTFMAFRDGSKVGEMKGAIPKSLESMLRAEAEKASAASA